MTEYEVATYCDGEFDWSSTFETLEEAREYFDEQNTHWLVNTEVRIYKVERELIDQKDLLVEVEDEDATNPHVRMWPDEV